MSVLLKSIMFFLKKPNEAILIASKKINEATRNFLMLHLLFWKQQKIFDAYEKQMKQ